MCKVIIALFFLSVLSLNAQTITMGEVNAPLSDIDSENSNLLLVQSATLAQPATLQSLSFYIQAAAGNLILGVYDSTGPNGGPGNLVAQTASVPVTQTGWLTLASPNVLLQPGMYWLAYTPNSDALSFWVDRTTGQTVYVSQAFGPMPALFPGNVNTTTSHWSFYATLSVGAPTPTPTPTPTPSPTPPPGVTLAWDAPSTITGYQVSYGTVHGGPYPTMVNAGNNLTVTLTGLTSGTTYYAIVQSFDVNGNLSCTMNEITFTAP